MLIKLSSNFKIEPFMEECKTPYNLKISSRTKYGAKLTMDVIVHLHLHRNQCKNENFLNLEETVISG